MENEISEKVETENENVSDSDGSSTTEQPDQGGTTVVEESPSQNPLDVDFGDLQAVVPIEIREHTPFVTESGQINVIHEITLGDFLISTLIMALLIFTVVDRVIRR